MKSKIMDLLVSNSAYKKSDNALMARIWYDHLKFKINDMSAIDLLTELKKGNLPNHKSITRLRRKIQNEYPHLKDKHVSHLRKEQEIEWKMKYSAPDTL